MLRTFLFLLLLFFVVLFFFIRSRKRKQPVFGAALIFSKVELPEALTIIEGDITFMQIAVGKKRRITIKPLNNQGGPAEVQEGSVSFSSSDVSLADVQQDPDNPLSFFVRGVAPGNCEIVASADADLGEGVETISNFLEVKVVPAKASHLDFEIGDEEDA